MTLSTKALPGEITSFEDFVARALSFDFYTDMSDDHRVYQAGRRRREIMDLYAKDNELAGKLWKRLCAGTAEGFMSGQLITRVTDVVLDQSSYGKEDTVAELKQFIIGYLARHCYTNTMLSRAARDAIAKEIPDLPYQWGEDGDKRDDMIDAWIDNWVEENV